MTLHDWIADWSQWAWPLLGNHLWQATLITFIAALLAYTLRRGPARVRYWMWLSAAINLAVPVFALTLLGGKLGLLPVLYETPSETTTPIQVFYQVTAPIAQSFEGAAAGVPTPRGHSELFCFLTMVWFAGLIFFASLWVRSRMRFARALKAGRRVFAGKEFEILRRVQSWLFIGREVGLVLSPGIIEPGVWGIWRPVVILPETISSHLSDAELESVVMHELVHVLRRDNLISSFQMVVCCAFWFHPFSWLIDRRLLVERERACDERVIELGGRSQVYAASLLKVLRFCLGTKMAGVSAASGSNLRRRIEQIMADSENKSLSISQRVLVCTIAAVVIGLSITAGFLAGNSAEAQNRVRWGKTAPQGGVAGGVPGGVAGGVPGGVEGGVPGGVEGGVPGGVLSLEPELVQDANLRERLKEAPPIYMRIDISNDAPLLITDASFKVVRLEQTSDRYAVRPQMNLTNKTDRKMSGFVLEIADSTGESGFHLGMFNPPLDPYDTYHAWENNLTFLSLSGSPESWVARVVGVMFKDGGKWGEVPPPPPPPPPPQLRPSNKTIELLEMSPDTQIEFINVEGSPVSITQASVKATAFEGATSSGDKNFTYWIKPSITMVNNTSRVIKALMISISSTASRSIGYKMMDAAIVAPHATFVYRDPTRYRLSYLAIPGSLDSLRIRLLGVVFENGETWGSVPPTPLPRILESMPGPPEGVGPAGEPPSGVVPAGEGRVQKARLINRVYPNYTEQARVNKVSGLVKMEVLVGADGKVKDARIIEGLHDGLNEEALRAAYKMRFRPTMRDSVPEESWLTISVEFSLR